MNYSFDCSICEHTVVLSLPVSKCESKPRCKTCGTPMARNFGADWETLQVNTYGCRDHNEVPETKRTVSNLGQGMTKRRARAIERKYAEDVQRKRDVAEAAGGNRGATRMSHSIPTELYWGKIRETKDKSYWRDKRNVARHKAWKLDR